MCLQSRPTQVEIYQMLAILAGFSASEMKGFAEEENHDGMKTEGRLVNTWP